MHATINKHTDTQTHTHTHTRAHTHTRTHAHTHTVIMTHAEANVISMFCLSALQSAEHGLIQIMCGEGQGAKDTSHSRALSLSTVDLQERLLF